MNSWDILALEPTKDVGAIRRAYAAAAAQYNPEDHPEEFLAVRQAYEQAMAYARGQVPSAAAMEQTGTPPLLKEASQPEHSSDAGGFTLRDESRPAAFASPALDCFRELYASQWRRDRKLWDQWFTSPEFLAGFQSPRFTKALRGAVEEAGDELPPSKEFQTALAVAYRFRAVVYRDHTEFALEEGAGFEGLDDILRIAVRGPLVRKLQGNDLVLSAAYQDYNALCDLVCEGIWNQPALKHLQTILNRYNSAYLQEKCSGNPERERNVVSLRLMEAFFADKPLPEDA